MARQTSGTVPPLRGLRYRHRVIHVEFAALLTLPCHAGPGLLQRLLLPGEERSPGAAW